MYDIFYGFTWVLFIFGYCLLINPRIYPDRYLYFLQIASLPLYVFATAYVIYQVYLLKCIGNLSKWTIIFQLLGSTAKFILQFFGDRDIYLLIGYGLSAFLSGILYYETKIYPVEI